MGKFFDTLYKLPKASTPSAVESVSNSLATMSGGHIERLRLHPTGKPSAPAVPDIDVSTADSRLVCLREPTSPASESFRIIRSRLLVSRLQAPPRVILITSAEPADGKSLVAANLSVTLAQELLSHVFLVDCDLRRPALHRLFGLPTKHGLREYLEGGASIDSFLLKTQIQQLTILPAGRSLDSPSQLLSSPKMQELVEELKSRHQKGFIVFDTPPAYVFADAAPLVSMADGVLLVVRHGKTSRHTVQDVIASVGAEKILGVVLNASDQVEREYKHYYHYYRRERKSD
jgi:capsular exopolysaccharide synthesis family protein